MLEEVVEIVGDAAGEDAEAFELLAFLELPVELGALFLIAVAVGEVAADGLAAYGLAVLKLRPRADLDGDAAAVAGEEIELEDGAVFTDEAGGGKGGLAGVGAFVAGEDDGDVGAGDLGSLPAEEALSGWVEGGDFSREIVGEDEVGGTLK